MIYRSAPPSAAISLTDLQQVLKPHSEEIVKRASILYSNIDEFSSYEDFLQDENPETLLDGKQNAIVVCEFLRYTCCYPGVRTAWQHSYIDLTSLFIFAVVNVVTFDADAVIGIVLVLLQLFVLL